jgi:proteic killer suppression protein
MEVMSPHTPAAGWAREIDTYTVSMYDPFVIRSFDDATTQDVFYGEDSRTARRLPKELWPVIRRKLDALHAATALNDLRVPPGNRLESLRGDQAGRHSIRVNEKFRITFRFENAHAWEVRCEDYH